MPGVLVADEIGLCKTITLLPAAQLCKLLTEKVVFGLLRSIFNGNTLEEWVNVARSNFPGIISEEWEWY